MVMFSQPHTKEPTLMERQFNQRDPVPSVSKGVAVTPPVRVQNNKNDRVVTVKSDEDCVEMS